MVVCMEPIDLSVITFNSSEWIDKFFESLLAQSYPLNLLSVYVTDNGSSDHSCELLTAWKSRLAVAQFVIQKASNDGFGAAHNNNFKHCRARFVLAANIDLQFEVDSISILVSTALADDITVAQWEMRQKPNEHPKVYDPVSLEVSWCSSACALFRREAFNAVGGYDDVFFMYGEDVDLSWRLRAAGYRLKYVPAATCWHFTYSNGTFKKIQFLGSLLGNLYIRARFGSEDEVAAGEAAYRSLLSVKWAHYPEQKDDLERNWTTYQNNFEHFRSDYRKYREHYSSVAKFVGDWDYELVRDGAYYDLSRFPSVVPLVSIVVRTYSGRQRLLRECLRSLQNQTYRNLEVIVVQDGGSDCSEVVSGLADNRFRFFRMPAVGRCQTGNRGLNEATGEFIGFLDDDDLFYADHVETLVSALQSNSEYRLAFGNAFEVKSHLVRSDSGIFEIAKTDSGYQIFDLPYSISELLFRNIMPIQAAIFSRKLYEVAGGFSPELENLEDWNLWTRYSALTRFLYVKKTTSLFRTPIDEESARSRVKLMEEYYDIAVEKQRHIYLNGVSAHEIREEFLKCRNELSRLNSDVSNLRAHIDELSAERLQAGVLADEEIRRLNASVNSLRSEYLGVVNSRMWRFLAPFRTVLEAIKRPAKS